jgi:Tfp pilus assembly protein FimV
VKLKSIVCLLGFHISAPALGIGLGDLNVHSYLEQPLHVSVKLLNPPATLNVDCLSLRPAEGGLPMPARTRLRIERTGEDAILHITTPQAISDPVAQFLLISDCEGRLQRDYALLLDPPPQIESASLTASGSQSPDAPASVLPAEASAPAGPAAASAGIAPAATPPRAPTAKPRRKAPAKPLVRTDTPRLVISGKPSPANAGSAPAGRDQDSALPAWQDANSGNLTTAELSDENAALNRRLAHLEAQLVALQKRNADIEAQLAAAALAQPAPSAAQASPWPTYLLGLVLLVGSGISLAWLRRRNRSLGWSSLRMPWAPPRETRPVWATAGIDPALLQFDAIHHDNSLRPSSRGPKG